MLETLLNEYNDYLTCLNIKPLMSLIEAFVVYKKNHNTSYSAVTMFWSVADLIEKFKGQSLYAHVNLIRSERSPLAKLAGELL